MFEILRSFPEAQLKLQLTLEALERTYPTERMDSLCVIVFEHALIDLALELPVNVSELIQQFPQVDLHGEILRRSPHFPPQPVETDTDGSL